MEPSTLRRRKGFPERSHQPTNRDMQCDISVPVSPVRNVVPALRPLEPRNTFPSSWAMKVHMAAGVARETANRSGADHLSS